MAVDQKGHTTVAAGEAPKRGALADGLLSVNDVIYVPTATAQSQLKTSLAQTSYPIASARPATTLRGNAPALHAIEYSRDGDVWLPASGVLHFANNSARDAWTDANSALLTPGDHCVSNNLDGVWNGVRWVQDTGWIAPTLNGNWNGYAGETARYKVRGGVVYLAGRVSGNASALPQIFKMPEGLWPSDLGFSLTWPAHSDNGIQIVQIDAAGVVICASQQGASTRQGISLASISYPVG